MTISTYSELQTAAANWLVRSDLTARIPEFITLAEARLNRVLRSRLAEEELSATLNASERVVSLPTRFTEALALWIVEDGQRYPLRYVNPANMEATTTTGRPEAWGIDADGLSFDRPADQSYSIILRILRGFQLSDSATTNDLLTNAPDVYLYATLSEAAPFLRDPDLASSYESRLTRAIRELNAKDARSNANAKLGTENGALQWATHRAGYNINLDS